MMVRRLLELCAVALVACALAVPASAQLTTGTISGTVKDSQGGVIPGATVVLTSETRGTQLPTAVTNSNGDFVVANVPPDTYAVQVTMEGFKALRRGGISVSAGDRTGIGTLTIEVGMPVSSAKNPAGSESVADSPTTCGGIATSLRQRRNRLPTCAP